MRMKKSFNRTISGLNNLHKFFKVDFVVYVEGGNKSYTKDEVLLGNFNKETEDIIFWNQIFNNFKADQSFKFKSVGSKNTIKELAEDLLTGKLKNTYLAMDNEFDEVYNGRIKHPQILYTFGYSWENDIWNANTIKLIIEELSAIKIKSKNIDKNFSSFLRNIKVAVYADAYLFKQKNSFLPRKKSLLFCVDFNPLALPKIKRQAIDNLLESKGLKRATVGRYGRNMKLDPLKFCFGHFLAGYCYQLIVTYLKLNHELTVISKEFIYRMALSKFFSTQFRNVSSFKHYETQLT